MSLLFLNKQLKISIAKAASEWQNFSSFTYMYFSFSPHFMHLCKMILISMFSDIVLKHQFWLTRNIVVPLAQKPKFQKSFQ